MKELIVLVAGKVLASIASVTIPTKVWTEETTLAQSAGLYWPVTPETSPVIVLSNTCTLELWVAEDTPTFTVTVEVVVDAIEIWFLFQQNLSVERGYRTCDTPSGLAEVASLVHLNPNNWVPIPILAFALLTPCLAETNVCAEISGDLPILTHIPVSYTHLTLPTKA